MTIVALKRKPQPRGISRLGLFLKEGNRCALLLQTAITLWIEAERPCFFVVQG